MSQQDTPVNALVNIKTILPNDIFYVGRLKTGDDCFMYGSDLIASLSKPVASYKNCLFNQSNEIEFGDISDGKLKSIAMHCYFERNCQSLTEIITISYTQGDYSLAESPINTVPNYIDNLGFSVSVGLNESKLVLIVTVNSQPVNVDMYYNILSTIIA